MRQHAESCLVNCPVQGQVISACSDSEGRHHAKTCREPRCSSGLSLTGASELCGVLDRKPRLLLGSQAAYLNPRCGATRQPSCPPGHPDPCTAQPVWGTEQRTLQAGLLSAPPLMPAALGTTKSAVLPGPAPESFCFRFTVSMATTSLPPIVFLS